MQTFYKVFLVLFVVLIAFNLYAIDWNVGFLNDENSKYVFSFAAGVIGFIAVVVLHTWSKLKAKA